MEAKWTSWKLSQLTMYLGKLSQVLSFVNKAKQT